MAFALAGLRASGPVSIQGMDSVADSFPGFIATLEGLR
jgi:5-enolpyruvylshikimate-3-phosphate synthase